MKKTNKLFALIRSMSKAEKVYFKRYTSMHVKGKENNYIRLFNTFADLTEYDEDIIRKKLRSSPVLKFFSASQNYLYKLLLKCLRAYHGDGSPAIRTAELVLDHHILRDLGLMEQSGKTAEGLMDLALEAEDLAMLLQGGFLLESSAFGKPDIAAFSLLQEKVYPLMDAQLERIKEMIEMGKLRARTHALYQRYGENTHDEVARKDALLMLSFPLLSEGRTYSTRSSWYTAFGTKSLLNSILGNYAACRKVNQQHLDALKRDPFFETERILGSYGLMLANRISICYRLGEYEEADHAFNEIRSLKFRSLQREASLFAYAYNNILGLYAESGRMDRSLDLIPEIATKLKKYDTKISEEGKISFYLNISSIYFMAQDYKTALKWINPILDSTDKSLRIDFQISARILNILTHYELGNFQLVDGLLISLRRFLIKCKRFGALEKIFYREIKKLNYLRDDVELRGILERFNHKLKTLRNADPGTIAYLLMWIKEKLRK